MLEIQAVKRQKTYVIEDGGNIIPVTNYTIEESQRASILDFLKKTDGLQYENNQSIGTMLVKSEREEVLGNLHKGLGEMNQMLNLISMIKGREFFGLQTCIPKQMMVSRDIPLPVSKRVLLKKTFFQSCREILSKGMVDTRTVLSSRKLFTSDCLSLRKSFRLVLLKNNNNNKTISVGDSIAVDCSYTSAGDAVNPSDSYHVPLTTTEYGASICSNELGRDLYTLEYSLQFGEKEILRSTSFSLHQIVANSQIYSVSTPVSHAGSSDVLSDNAKKILTYCADRRHDVLCRRQFHFIRHEAVSLHNQWTVSSSPYTDQEVHERQIDIFGEMAEHLAGCELFSSLNVKTVERGRVVIAVSPSLSLSIRLVPQSATGIGFETGEDDRMELDSKTDSEGWLALLQDALRHCILSNELTFLNMIGGGRLDEPISEQTKIIPNIIRQDLSIVTKKGLLIHSLTTLQMCIRKRQMDTVIRDSLKAAADRMSESLSVAKATKKSDKDTAGTGTPLDCDFTAKLWDRSIRLALSFELSFQISEHINFENDSQVGVASLFGNKGSEASSKPCVALSGCSVRSLVQPLSHQWRHPGRSLCKALILTVLDSAFRRCLSAVFQRLTHQGADVTGLDLVCTCPASYATVHKSHTLLRLFLAASPASATGSPHRFLVRLSPVSDTLEQCLREEQEAWRGSGLKVTSSSPGQRMSIECDFSSAASRIGLIDRLSESLLRVLFE